MSLVFPNLDHFITTVPGSAAMTVLGDVLCGREKAFGVEDSYRIADRANNENNPSRRRRKRATATQELSDYDKRQMEELGSKRSCIILYYIEFK